MRVGRVFYSFILSFPGGATLQQSGSAPEIAAVVHHVITSSPESVPPPVLCSTHPSSPVVVLHLGHLTPISVSCVACCRDEEKGKKMWSKYLEREDSKIVGESRQFLMHDSLFIGYVINLHFSDFLPFIYHQ